MRRVFDLTCALVGVVLLSPLLALSALAIALEDRGPVFYVQPRVGKNFRIFGVLKFRTMIPGAEGGGRLTAPGDSRVTRVGKVLRKYKIDELPQLLNVIRGEMQLVGSRPEVEPYVRRFPREYAQLLRECPGITDPASLAYRNEEAQMDGRRVEEHYLAQILPDKLRLSIEYGRGRTFRSDVRILFRTVLGLGFPGKRSATLTDAERRRGGQPA